MTVSPTATTTGLRCPESLSKSRTCGAARQRRCVSREGGGSGLAAKAHWERKAEAVS